MTNVTSLKSYLFEVSTGAVNEQFWRGRLGFEQLDIGQTSK